MRVTASAEWPSNRLLSLQFDFARCRASLDAFEELLGTDELDEQVHVLPFFRQHPHLAAFLGSYNPQLGIPDLLAYELSLFGRFTADLVVGNTATQNFVFVEFEDGKATSIFRQRGRRTPHWSERFEQGYSQIIDWLQVLDNQRRTPEFEELFGTGSISVVALLVVGRQAALSPAERSRLRWRREKVVVDSKHVLCFTYDELLDDLRRRIATRS